MVRRTTIIIVKTCDKITTNLQQQGDEDMSKWPENEPEPDNGDVWTKLTTATSKYMSEVSSSSTQNSPLLG